MRIIQFNGLDPRTIQRVVDKLLVEVEAQLEQKGVQLHVDDAAREWLARKGYDPKMGARPMARVIQESIKRPLAEELLFGRLAGGGHAFVTLGTGRHAEGRGARRQRAGAARRQLSVSGQLRARK